MEVAASDVRIIPGVRKGKWGRFVDDSVTGVNPSRIEPTPVGIGEFGPGRPRHPRNAPVSCPRALVDGVNPLGFPVVLWY